MYEDVPTLETHKRFTNTYTRVILYMRLRHIRCEVEIYTRFTSNKDNKDNRDT